MRTRVHTLTTAARSPTFRLRWVFMGRSWLNPRRLRRPERIAQRSAQTLHSSWAGARTISGSQWPRITTPRPATTADTSLSGWRCTGISARKAQSSSAGWSDGVQYRHHSRPGIRWNLLLVGKGLRLGYLRAHERVRGRHPTLQPGRQRLLHEE